MLSVLSKKTGWKKRRGREVEWESARCSLACLSSTKTNQNTNTLDQPVDIQQTRGPRRPLIVSLIVWGSPEVLCCESTKRHLIMPHIYSIGMQHTALLYCHSTSLCCCGLLATDGYVTDQRLGIGYWLLLGSMVAILNTTPRWR